MPTPAHHLAFGQTLRELRLEQDLSQEALALRSRLDRSYVGDIERGQRNPGLGSVFKLIEGLGVAPSVMFARFEEVLARRNAKPRDADAAI